MYYTKRASWMAAIAFLAVSLSHSQQPAVSTDSCQMVLRALTAYSQLEPGMLRAEVEKDFLMDGGISSRSEGRYVYKECIYIKLEVEYEPAEERGVGSPRDVVKTLSKLTIDYAASD